MYLYWRFADKFKFRPETLQDIYDFIDLSDVDRQIVAFQGAIQALKNVSGG